MNQQTVKSFIQEYKNSFDRINKHELYKWKAVKQFQTHWNIDASDFASMLETSLSKTANLLDSHNTFPFRMVCENAKQSPEKIRLLFKGLYDENLDLTERVKTFRAEFKTLNESNFSGKNNYQGQRTVVVYLTLKYPERYFFYKFGMFDKFSDIVNYHYKPIKGRYENIIQFQNLCELLKYELENDQELIKLHKERIDDDCYYDKNLKILTQDFVYAVVRHLDVEPLLKETEPENIFELSQGLTTSVQLAETGIDFTPRTINHIQNNIANKRIGDLGEIWVVNYEREKLRKLGKPKLANKVEHTAKNFGDGAGFDVMSFNENGDKMFIEVKTTKGGLNSTFYITRNELERSLVEKENYYVYRLYEFDDDNNTGKLLILNGELTNLCQTPINYKVTMKKPACNN
ncbi:DUF3883 domain-containing protein [Gelidibacter salicanalis]|uniref:DUF3883 domain-containing protein n=1 Tax=Gelidibacter salicanalis TaxID=291193 RepID=A0A934KQI1_9FLAO|nr:DUF3883 domain-containing protein [Gelidibacter salicanalis]MBJ7881634.1 DUF3883 domain-containing protein [Gelidibacter salicanalis]